MQGEHRLVPFLEHLRRDVNRPDGETLQDAGQAVVVVDVGVREDRRRPGGCGRATKDSRQIARVAAWGEPNCPAS